MKKHLVSTKAALHFSLTAEKPSSCNEAAATTTEANLFGGSQVSSHFSFSSTSFSGAFERAAGKQSLLVPGQAEGS